MKKDKIYYYKNEITDDFAGTNIKQVKVSDDFVYIRDCNPLWRFGAFLAYYIFAKPVVFLVMKIGFIGSHVKNRKVLKQLKHQGYFIYGNHTNIIPDAFTPNLLTNKRNYIIVNPDATSIKGIQTFVMMMGAIPLASSFKSAKKFYECVKSRIESKRTVTIYPEAHIWPYYTKIRNFPSNSFHYPVDFNAPCISLTTCYSRYKGLLKFVKKPKITTYIDGPFYPDTNLSKKEAKEKLRNEVYEAMNKRVSMYSDYEYRKYVKIEEN